MELTSHVEWRTDRKIRSLPRTSKANWATFESMTLWRKAQEQDRFGASVKVNRFVPVSVPERDRVTEVYVYCTNYDDLVAWCSPLCERRSFTPRRTRLPGLVTAEQELPATEEEFHHLAETWARETRRSAVVALRYIHPAYQRILAMPDKHVVVGLILKRLKHRPDRWFAALSALTNANPVAAGADFDSAIQSWLKWGRDQGYDV